MTVRIGLTGPIACGKSTVAGWLAALGAAVVDADEVAREVVEPGEPALDAVVGRFGRAVLLPDGSLDRPALGRVVFGDPAALADLEAIVHPAVRLRLEGSVAEAERAGAPAVVVEAIKLVEAGYASRCDEVWLVTCSRDAQRSRLVRRGTPAADADQRIAAQGPDLVDRLRASATRVIDTSGPKDATQAAVEDAYRAALGLSAR